MADREIQRREVLILPEELRRGCGVKAGDKVIVGVSGGSDSLALLLTLRELGVRVFAAHFDHRLREESDADAAWVREFCAKRRIPVAIAVGNVREAAEKFGKSIEDTARHLRYHFLFTLAARERAVAVAVAHHADDQVETVLMNILRGTGIDGLSGMQSRRCLKEFSEIIPLIRPFLTTKRDVIAAWLEKQGIRPLMDSSNNDLTYTRNRVRHELIPYLKEHFNPNLPDTILRMSELAKIDSDYLDMSSVREAREIFIERSDQVIYCRRENYSRLNVSIKQRILRRMIAKLGSLKNGLSYETIQSVNAFFTHSEDAAADALQEIDVVEGRTAFIWRDMAGFSVGPVDRARLYALRLPSLVGETIQTFPLFLNEVHRVGNILIRFKARDLESDADREEVIADMKKHSYLVYLDEAGLQGNLVVRAMTPGERFVPFGKDGAEVDLSDFMMNRKIPAEARTVYPMVCDDLGPVWIPKLRSAERAKVHDGTKRVIWIRLELEERSREYRRHRFIDLDEIR